MAQKKKVRVAFKKNRQKRTRANDLTGQYRGDDPMGAEPIKGERVRPKGELSRHRTIIEEDLDAGDRAGEGSAAETAAPAADGLRSCLTGRVIRIHGLISLVQDDDGRVFPCHVRRVLKTREIEGRNAVAVGDHVRFRPGGGGGEEGLVEKVEPRRGTISRGYRHREHVIVANVDQVLVVSAFEEPGLKPPLIDRYLISAEAGGVRPVIVLNKADLVNLALFQWVVGLYTQLGYETVVASAADGRGIDRLKELLAEGSTTAIAGQSGVGKSSLLNAIQPGLNLRVREVSTWTAKGKHTTSTAELIRLETGGYVVDTPGLRQFELWGLPPGEVGGRFLEFRPYLRLCRFPDCSHTHENDCAVKDALHFGQIHLSRYDSYLKIYLQQPVEGE